jgi:hypothetical protein
MDEDIWCLYTPKGGPRIAPMKEEEIHMIWSKEAAERLSQLPFFLQKMIKGRVERRAREEGLEIITLEFMEDLRKKTFGNSAPIFKDGRFKGLSGE